MAVHEYDGSVVVQGLRCAHKTSFSVSATYIAIVIYVREPFQPQLPSISQSVAYNPTTKNHSGPQLKRASNLQSIPVHFKIYSRQSTIKNNLGPDQLKRAGNPQPIPIHFPNLHHTNRQQTIRLGPDQLN
jgi:hypothetical protein